MSARSGCRAHIPGEDCRAVHSPTIDRNDFLGATENDVWLDDSTTSAIPFRNSAMVASSILFLIFIFWTFFRLFFLSIVLALILSLEIERIAFITMAMSTFFGQSLIRGRTLFSPLFSVYPFSFLSRSSSFHGGRVFNWDGDLGPLCPMVRRLVDEVQSLYDGRTTYFEQWLSKSDLVDVRTSLLRGTFSFLLSAGILSFIEIHPLGVKENLSNVLEALRHPDLTRRRIFYEIEGRRIKPTYLLNFWISFLNRRDERR